MPQTTHPITPAAPGATAADAARAMAAGAKCERSFTVQRAAVNAEARTVELAFSSEQPYERWWGIEILDNTATAVRLGRLSDGGALLMDHNTRDHVGVVESVRIDADRVGRAVVRFGKSARAQEVWQDVLDGIRRHVSVGYIIHAATLVETKDGVETYRVTDWEPYEVSLVSVPADPTVGVGRSAQAGQDQHAPPTTTTPNATPSTKAQTMPVPTTIENTSTPEQNAAAREAAIATARKELAEDVSTIIAMGEAFAAQGGQHLASEALRDGKTAAEFKDIMLKHVAKQPVPKADVGLTEKEARAYSFLRALNALANPNDKRAQDAAGFEREASSAAATKMGREARGFLVPHDVLRTQQRDLTVGTPTAGGHTVATNLLAASFIDLLRNRMSVTAMGARFMAGLVGNVAIPRATGGGTVYWVAESGAPTESGQAFDQVTMTPKTVGAFTDLSRKLLLQSSIDVESFVRDDLATIMALGIDLAALNGSGSSNQPLGLLGTSGIGSVAGGTNGAAPTWANMVDLETQVAIANADVGTMGYLTNAKVRGKLKVVSKVSGQNGFVWADDNTVNGYRTGVSNQVPSNLTKGTAIGVCSAIVFGNFSDLIIGQWGALDLTVDPYTNSTSGTVRVVALQDCDVCVRHPESFAAMKDALTT